MDPSKPIPKLTRHLFVCTNERAATDPRGSCSAKGSRALLDKLKSEYLAAVRGLETRPSIRIQAAGCLDACARGIVMVVYPEGVWYGGVQESDCNEIIQSHLIGGVPVERLRIPEK